MKRIMTLMLAVLFLLSACPVLAEQADGNAAAMLTLEPVEDTIGIQRGTQLVVGSTTELAGFFATDLWSNNTADIDVRALLHGYSTVAWTDVYGMVLDPMVVHSLRTDAQAGGQTYTLTLSDNLSYNDGTPITAKDYVFSLLLTGSKAVAEIGGMPSGLSYIVGYDAYRMEEAAEVSGIRLISDHEFSITVGAEYLNYFYALALLNVTPYPIHVIAPGCEIYDDGSGAYIAASPEAADIDAQALGFVPGQFDAQMLAVTMLDPETGYVFNPRVTSGPYSLETYDSELHEARFVINERYAGNYEAQKPHIERLVYQRVANETMISELESGTVGLLNKVTSGVIVGEGLTLANQEGKARVSTYLRTGFAFLSFACEEGVASNEAVRKAVAHCIDKAAYVASSVGQANAMPVYGYYGLGQWMVSQAFDADPENGDTELNVQDALAELEVPYDLEAAKALLNEDGWVLNEQGEAFVEGVDAIRYRDEEGELVPLVIRWAKTENNMLADATQRALEGPFETLGIGLEVTEMPFSEMMAHYYRHVDRAYDMFYLASNFGYVFDPYYDYHTDDEYQGLMNTTGLRDEQLMELAKDMRETHPMAIREYTEEWLAFQREWVERMPMVPLYSNIYFDFYENELQDYNIAMHPTWANAIVYAWIGEPTSEDADAMSVDGGFTEDDDESDMDGDIVIID